MKYEHIYLIISMSSLIDVILFFICIFRKKNTMSTKSIGVAAIVSTIGIVLSFYSGNLQSVGGSIGQNIYYIGEIIYILAGIQLLKLASENNKLYYTIRNIFGVMTVCISIVALIIDAKPHQVTYYLVIWNVITTSIFMKYFINENRSRLILCAFAGVHMLSLLGFSYYEVRDYNYLIIGLFYEITGMLVSIVLSLNHNQEQCVIATQNLQFVDDIMKNTSFILNRVDCEGNNLYSNKGLITLLNYKEDWKHISEIRGYMHKEDQDKIRQIMICLKPERLGAKFELRLKHQSGRYIWVGMEINPVYDDKHIKVGNIISWKDMTTEKIIYVDLMKSQRKFYQLFEGIREAIFIVPFSKDYIYSNINQFNKAACQNFGYREHEYKNMSLADLDIRFLENKDTKQGQSYEELIEILFKEEKIIYETEYRTREGKLIPVEVIDYKFMLDNKPMIMSVVRDISERNIIKESKRLETTKRDFLANISHELRTPLNVIILTLQSVELYINDILQGKTVEDEQNDKMQHYMHSMKQNSLRLLKLVNNFMCMAKIDSGFYEANKQSYNIVTLVEDISQSVVAYIENNGIKFEFDTDVEEKVVMCDVNMIEKIILNLISNAVKFTPIGGTLSIHIFDKGNAVEIKVSDTGKGIPEGKKKIIFERFKQADKTFTRREEGCGIGLALVKHFVKQHDGVIEVESVEGQGSTFTITLPAFESIDVPYENYDFDAEIDTLYKRELEFSDIINREVEEYK